MKFKDTCIPHECIPLFYIAGMTPQRGSGPKPLTDRRQNFWRHSKKWFGSLSQTPSVDTKTFGDGPPKWATACQAVWMRSTGRVASPNRMGVHETIQSGVSVWFDNSIDMVICGCDRCVYFVFGLLRHCVPSLLDNMGDDNF